MAKIIVAFRDFANSPKNALKLATPKLRLLLALFVNFYYYHLYLEQRSGDDYITRSFVVCTPHQMLFR